MPVQSRGRISGRSGVSATAAGELLSQAGDLQRQLLLAGVIVGELQIPFEILQLLTERRSVRGGSRLPEQSGNPWQTNPAW